MWGIDKPVIKKTLIEEANELVEESKGLKSVFTTMKTNLENKNVALGEKSAQIADVMKELTNADANISNEALSNSNVISQLDKIIG